MLGALANYGGPTHTHALLPGSPALDVGDPGFNPNAFNPPLVHDQRGAGFDRVANAGGGLRIDIGAYESQGVPTFAPGDYNQNGVVDAADYVVWRKTLGDTVVEPFSGADGNGNSMIDESDYQVWRSNFGATLRVTAAPVPAVPPGAQVNPVTQPAGGLAGAATSALAAASAHSPTTVTETLALSLASGAWFALFAPERQSHIAATAFSSHLDAVTMDAAGNCLLLVFDGAFNANDRTPPSADAFDAAFSDEADEMDLLNPLPVTLADL
jgi:hypothetical protein